MRYISHINGADLVFASVKDSQSYSNFKKILTSHCIALDEAVKTEGNEENKT